MALIHLPERKILGRYKPDFPVELNPDNWLLSEASQVYVYGYNGGYSDLVTGEKIVNSVPSLAYSGITSSGRALRSTFNGNGGPISNSLNIPTFTFRSEEYNTVAIRLNIASVVNDPYLGGIVGSYSGSAGITIGTPDSTHLTITGISSGFYYTRWANIPFSLGVDTSIIAQTIPTNVAPYYGFMVFVDGIDVSAYGTPTLNGGGLNGIGNNTMGFTPSIGLNPTIYNNYYGSDTYLSEFVVAQGKFWTDAQRQSYLANPSQLVRPRRRTLIFPLSSGSGVALSGSTTATGTGVGTASVEIPIQSSSVAVASGTGVLSQSIPMAASATATVTGTGDLQISIPFNASAIATAAGSASMSIAQALAGSGTATGSGSGTLSTNGQMSGSGTATGTGAGTISLSIALSAAAIAHAVGSGQLSLSGSLSGSGTASGTGTGNLTQTIPLVSSSLASVSGTGTMVNSVPLTSSAVVNASGVGMLGVQVGFNAQAFADAIGTGNMSLIIRLSGQAVAQAVASGVLEQSGILQANPRFTINALGRNFTINALGRNFTINAL